MPRWCRAFKREDCRPTDNMANLLIVSLRAPAVVFPKLNFSLFSHFQRVVRLDLVILGCEIRSPKIRGALMQLKAGEK